MTVIVAFILPLIALRFGGAFAYILTTKRMMVKVDRTRLLVRLFMSFKKVADADGFVAYDLRYLNGARVYVGLWGYGNVSVFENVSGRGELRGDLDTYESKPAFFRDRRYVKVFYRRLACFHLAETFCNVYFGIKDVGRLGDVLNDQCASRRANLSQRSLLILRANQLPLLCVLFRKEGRWPSSRTLERDAVDAAASSRVFSRGRTTRSRTAKSCGPDASTLASSWR
jgi:hypothetical protein